MQRLAHWLADCHAPLFNGLANRLIDAPVQTNGRVCIDESSDVAQWLLDSLPAATEHAHRTYTA